MSNFHDGKKDENLTKKTPLIRPYIGRLKEGYFDPLSPLKGG
jgi:hypothetical protein